jgi:hypothetical protein
MENYSKEVDSVVRPEPNRYLLGVEGTHVLLLETRDIDAINPRLTQRWHAIAMPQIERANLVEIPAPFWPNSLERAEFRLKVTAAEPAAFGSCYLTSPGIGGPAEEVGSYPEPKIRSAVETFTSSHHSPLNLSDQIGLDAVMEMAAPGQEPESCCRQRCRRKSAGWGGYDMQHSRCQGAHTRRRNRPFCRVSPK